MSNGLNELKKNILTDEKCTELIELMQTSNACAMDFVADLVAGMKILSRESKDGTSPAGSDIKMEDRVTDVYAMIKDTVAMIQQAYAISDTVCITYGIVPTVSKIVHLDVCVQRMLMNLLSNAVLHTASGLIHVEVQLCAANNPGEPPHRMLEFKVRDTGEGIDSSRLESIFDPFTSYSGSVGLGLYLVKQQSSRLGGSCGLDSEPGQGTVAWFRVPYILPAFDPRAAMLTEISNYTPPLSAAHVPERADDAVSIRVDSDVSENATPVKILLVDHLRTTQRLHALALEACGYEVEMASSANEGFAKMTEKEYTLVLCDIYMRPEPSPNRNLNGPHHFPHLKNSTANLDLNLGLEDLGWS